MCVLLFIYSYVLYVSYCIVCCLTVICIMSFSLCYVLITRVMFVFIVLYVLFFYFVCSLFLYCCLFLSRVRIYGFPSHYTFATRSVLLSGKIFPQIIRNSEHNERFLRSCHMVFSVGTELTDLRTALCSFQVYFRSTLGFLRVCM